MLDKKLDLRKAALDAAVRCVGNPNHLDMATQFYNFLAQDIIERQEPVDATAATTVADEPAEAAAEPARAVVTSEVVPNADTSTGTKRTARGRFGK